MIESWIAAPRSKGNIALVYGKQNAALKFWHLLSIQTMESNKMMSQHITFMQVAIDEAKKGLNAGGIPIGSLLVHNNNIIGAGHNQRVQKNSAILHGEMHALENAGRLPAEIYKQSVLYTTLSPCSMCAGAILLYGIPLVVIGENQTFMGEEELLHHKGVELIVLQDTVCITMMEHFIAQYPHLWYEDIGKISLTDNLNET